MFCGRIYKDNCGLGLTNSEVIYNEEKKER